jgi:RNA polymerase sigma factor (sigma-70 family)
MIDDVVSRCQKGEDQAFFELFHIHGEMIQKIIFRITRNTEWQRDIFQDVAEQIIENIATFRGECKFTTWLYRITVNSALLFLKRENKYKNMIPFDETTIPDGLLEESELGRIHRKKIFDETIRALNTLSADYKEILSLFYCAERSIGEISELIGKSNGAVKAVLWKGRRAIIKKLKTQGLMKVL